MEAPKLIKPIPLQSVNELAAYGPVDLNDYIKAPNDSYPFTFRAETSAGAALPTGVICTAEGMLTGIPAKGTANTYNVIVTISNTAGSLKAEFVLSIKPSPVSDDLSYLDKLKAQVWEAVEHDLPVPDFGDIYGKEITLLEIYYLLERWGVLKIWDAFNLEPPGELKLLQLEGASEHYHVYDRGSCLVAAPKDLFSHERTLDDGLRTAQAMAKEVYRRGWTVELSGFDKLTRAAWVQLQQLGEKHGKTLDVINYEPTPEDVKLSKNQLIHKGL